MKAGMKRAIIKVTAYVPQKVVLILVHLSLRRWVRKRQLKTLIPMIKKIKEPVILLGDFNTFGGPKELRSFLEETGLNSNVGKDKKKFTHPSYHPFRILDYILTSKKIKVKKFKILKSELSDHLPVMIDFEVKGGK